jgi:GNAT superfamily N-acetyltransferase
VTLRSPVEIRGESVAALGDYLRVSIAFDVRSVFDVDETEESMGAAGLQERRLDVPYRKDYDAITEPWRWPTQFDMTRWGMLSAFHDRHRVGGAIVALRTPGVDMLEGRDDLAVLWDIRVDPAHRGCGVGAALFRAAESWAASRGCTQLKVETQNVNVPACRFYAKHGCVLAGVRRGAYALCPDEIQLLWRKPLARPA